MRMKAGKRRAADRQGGDLALVPQILRPRRGLDAMINGAELWQTGGDLIDAKTGIIMHALADATARAIVAPPVNAALAPHDDTGQHFPRRNTPRVVPASKSEPDDIRLSAAAARVDSQCESALA
jgi:hypothetical protein